MTFPNLRLYNLLLRGQMLILLERIRDTRLRQWELLALLASEISPGMKKNSAQEIVTHL